MLSEQQSIHSIVNPQIYCYYVASLEGPISHIKLFEKYGSRVKC